MRKLKMINLPDFTKCIQIQKLFLDMGIREISVSPLPKNQFVRTVQKTVTVTVPNTTQLTYREKLKNDSVPFAIGDLVPNKDTGLLGIHGTNCCIYIKNQRQYYDLEKRTSNYKFHLCECSTIQSMIRGGRKQRYVATTRDDGWFPVNAQSEYRVTECWLKLELCENCKQILLSKGMYEEPFSLKNFFGTYQTEIKQTFQREEIVVAQEPYAPNHKEIADAYKKQENYCCQICGVHCEKATDCLHLHHKDGNGQNNSPDNLLVLCAACHSNEFNHQRMKTTFAPSIRKIKELQKEQGIF